MTNGDSRLGTTRSEFTRADMTTHHGKKRTWRQKRSLWQSFQDVGETKEDGELDED